MVPSAYQVPFALILIAGGALAGFAGYRLFRIVLAVYGFILGALVTTSMVGADSMLWNAVAAITGGLLGAVISNLAYFAGVALLGAGAGALLLHVVLASFDRQPHILLVVLAAIGGAVLAMVLQKYVIILTTAFGGAWTVLVGVLAIAGEGRAVAATARGDVWIAYPLNPAPGQQWVVWAWFALGIIGSVVQLKQSGRKR